MQRVSGANYLANGAGVGKNTYQDYNPATGQAGTTPNAAALTALQEEIASLIEWQGLALNPLDNTQLRQAIIAYVENTIVADSGDFNGRTQLTTSTVLEIDQAGGLFEIDTPGIIVEMPAAAGNLGKVFVIYNASSGTATLSAGNFNTAYGVGVSSITLPPLSSVYLASDGTSWNAVGGSGSYGAPVKPQLTSGIGQWAQLVVNASTITLPVGGTWAYFWSNNGAYGVGIAAGGATLTSGTIYDAFGFAWRIA